ncbi:class I SAM-dependent methyltransferase [Phaeovulum vinaykumarii]|uniref:Methyltransferase domain-containing protein n=1 Tax=Phaeovulum vinaykumarii TaxID=407234 RepID=A0A1N7LY11_9RHOB|nr:class I SAM-dependent methyltransferase [Phaeovulum vinaykumarii]SIS78682.1 Methyltransferase domain-containing protein [Phaeovulum vinaykumarii]SOC06895.1 methyltransferase family protein [Phaeovulum vinaykumarii]
MTRILTQYLARYSKVKGFLSRENALVWDFFLRHQTAEGLHGNLMELGVFHGQSSALLAMHAAPTETAVFIDLNVPDEVRGFLQAECAGRTVCLSTSTTSIRSAADLPDVPDLFRFIHIDGEHTGTAFTHDLTLADSLLDPCGIICIDDFFSPRYPQITDALFRYLVAHPYRLSLVLVGLNKGYLVRPLAARGYLRPIAEKLMPELRNHGTDWLELHKTTYPDEMNCFGLQPRYEHDRLCCKIG